MCNLIWPDDHLEAEVDVQIVYCQEHIVRPLLQRKNVRLLGENRGDLLVVDDQFEGVPKLDAQEEGALEEGDPRESVPEDDPNAVCDREDEDGEEKVPKENDVTGQDQRPITHF